MIVDGLPLVVVLRTQPAPLLRACFQAAPKPLYPAAFAQERGLDRAALDRVFDELRLKGLVRLTEWVKDTGQGYTLKQLYQTVAYILFSEIEPVYISNLLVEANSCILDNALAQRVLKWEPQIELTTGVQWAIERLQQQTRQDTLIGTQLLESCLGSGLCVFCSSNK